MFTKILIANRGENDHAVVVSINCLPQSVQWTTARHPIA